MVTTQRRAGVHAALGEPSRLALVDALVPGDASPGELGARFSMATNLLAHHLRVLEDAGVIRRVRSEGDRRRSYVQLCLDDPIVQRALTGAGTEFTHGRPVPRVVFVCTANSARSQLAAGAWNLVSDVPATSAGTHPAPRVNPRAITVGHRHGLRIGKWTTTQVAGFLQPDDLVVAVCDNAHEDLPAQTPRLHWAIPDPVRIDTDDAFEDAFADITRRVSQLAAAIHD